MFDAAVPVLGSASAVVPCDAAAETPRLAHRFTLLAEPSAGLLSHLLQPLAKRDLTPDLFRARRIGGMIRVEVTVEADDDAARRIAGDLRRVIGVARLEVERGRVAA